MPRRKKPPHGRKFNPNDLETITLPDSRRQPTKAEMNEKHSFFERTGTTPEQWGDTEEERIGNMTAYLLRPVKIRRAKR